MNAPSAYAHSETPSEKSTQTVVLEIFEVVSMMGIVTEAVRRIVEPDAGENAELSVGGVVSGAGAPAMRSSAAFELRAASLGAIAEAVTRSSAGFVLSVA